MNKPSSATIPEVRRPMMVSSHEVEFRIAKREMLIDEVTQIVQRVPFIEMAPPRLFSTGLLSELADASDRLAAKVAKLHEAQGADR